MLSRVGHANRIIQPIYKNNISRQIIINNNNNNNNNNIKYGSLYVASIILFLLSFSSLDDRLCSKFGAIHFVAKVMAI
jgi:hypothetical protein